jgi:hypothetical protein
MRYYCWMSSTCYECRRAYGGPRYHASSRARGTLTSPCDSTVTVVEAPSRAEALRLYKARLKGSP